LKIGTRGSALALWQAKHVQAGLEKLVRGLVDLSATDDAAKKIVTKYGIKIGSNPPAPATSSSP